MTYIPTKEELIELGFKIHQFHIYYLAEFMIEKGVVEIEYNSLNDEWSKGQFDMEYLHRFYPSSLEDIRTLIRLLTTQ